MTEPGSITQCVLALQGGDQDAAARLWNEYFERLLPIARRAITGKRSESADEEDVVLSAFHNFFRSTEEGRFREIGNRDEVWKLLVVITRCKSLDLVRAEASIKRGGGKPRSDELLQQITCEQPTPAFTAELVDETRWMLTLARREDDCLHLILVRKLEQKSNQEIAAELECSVRTVERKLRLFQGIWQRDMEQRLLS